MAGAPGHTSARDGYDEEQRDNLQESLYDPPPSFHTTNLDWLPPSQAKPDACRPSGSFDTWETGPEIHHEMVPESESNAHQVIMPRSTVGNQGSPSYHPTPSPKREQSTPHGLLGVGYETYGHDVHVSAQHHQFGGVQSIDKEPRKRTRRSKRSRNKKLRGRTLPLKAHRIPLLPRILGLHPHLIPYYTHQSYHIPHPHPIFRRRLVLAPDLRPPRSPQMTSRLLCLMGHIGQFLLSTSWSLHIINHSCIRFTWPLHTVLLVHPHPSLSPSHCPHISSSYLDHRRSALTFGVIPTLMLTHPSEARLTTAILTRIPQPLKVCTTRPCRLRAAHLPAIFPRSLRPVGAKEVLGWG
jgi:hypothetical protein